ncbi:MULTISPECIES: hypothetical protein [Lactiplantibacillus]|jgi:hypothetical protein|uniref:hypothetical protein n=1 Tax=Lactiplantibacillus TaxID=2767842 RepID=UPI000EA9718A|nr:MULTISPECIES: hypothetical protein [Lactiplantibacillus]AYG39208.1 hypothetical protein CFK27_15285 [Lactiplantibacillus pentosus]AYG41868.1 hypothetical protein CFI14_12440 [Lactiplantibacillus pentosus]MBU7449405.1 hypothetical protein [Lactiplantibacillus sp. 7.2.4]MBU7481770.1 hypothetical protein [Lactiplantibacillus pentosus]MBU7502857.1 hypothetical protein [Lactiplantibacillus pentosus]
MKVEKLENSISKEEMEIDYYVPVSISFPENDLEAEGLYYYRFINKEYSFVEFKINSVSKKIVNVTVTSINDIQNSDFIFNGSIPEANPIINIYEFEYGDVITNNRSFEFYIGEKKIFFILDDEEISAMIMISNHFFALLNRENDIVGAQIANFNDEDWNALVRNLKEAGKI